VIPAVRIGALLLALAWATPALAQLTVTPDPPPAGAVRLRDFWNGTLVQPGPAAVGASIRVTVRGAAGEPLFEAKSLTRTFAAGTHRINSLSLEPLTVTTVAPAVETALLRTGALPDGRYTLCLEAVDDGGFPLSPPGCVDFEVASVLPPIAMEPANGSVTSAPFIIWTWFMQPNTAAGEAVVCDLRVVEMLGGQTPEEAMRRNPPVLLKTNLRSSAWQTNEAARSLKPDQTYAWKLIARVGSRVASESEIQTFTYLAPEELPLDAGAASAEGGAPALPAAPAVPAAEVPAPSAGGEPAAPAAPAATAGPDSAAAASAPSGPRPLEWRAVARATMLSTNRVGTQSRTPADYARLEVDPTLLIYGSPLALNLLLTTEQDPRQSEIQRGAVNFDQGRSFSLAQRIEGRSLQLQRSREELLSDTLRLVRDDLDRLDAELAQLQAIAREEPGQTVRELEQLGLVNPAEAAALRIPAFAFGSVAPDHGRLLLSGVTVNGGMVEFQPGRWHADVAAGKLAREDNGELVLPTTPEGTRPELFQDLYSARLGVGRRSANHLYLTGLYARDDRQSRAIVGLANPGAPAPMQENLVLGLAGRARGARRALFLDGDVQASLFSDDRNAPQLGNLPRTGTLRSLFGSRVRETSAVDWSGGLRGSAELAGGRTRLTSGVRFVGPGYHSVGVRGLRRDNFQFDGGWDQRLAGGRFTLGTQWGHDRTGVVLKSTGVATVNRLSTRLSGKVPRLPAFDALYSFNGQDLQPGGAPEKLRNRSNLGSLRLRQPSRIGAARGVTTLSGDVIVATSNDVGSAHRAGSVQVSQALSLPSRLGFLARGSRSRTDTQVEDGRETDVYAWEGSLTWTPRGAFTVTAGGIGSRSALFDQGGGFVSATMEIGRLGALDLSWNFNDARAREPNVRGFLDRSLRLQLLTRDRR